MSQLAQRHGLSRSTLLYYDRIGLLPPSGRSASGYRRYSAADSDRLASICRYRRAGLALDLIRRILDRPESELPGVLSDRVNDLNGEIGHLREQQRFILSTLAGEDDQKLRARPFLDCERFVQLLCLAGIGPAQQTSLHRAFERLSAEEHQAFLEFLCLPDQDIARIRAASRS